MKKKQNFFSALKNRINLTDYLFKTDKKIIPFSKKKKHLGVIIGKRNLTFVIPDPDTKKKPIINKFQRFQYPENTSYLSENFGKFVFECLKKIPKELSSSAWIALPYDEIETRYIMIPKTKESASENAVYWTLKKELDFDTKNYFLDFEKIEHITERGISKEGVCAYIAEKKLIYNLKHCFEDSGCKVIGITSVPFTVQTILKNKEINIFNKNICFVNPKKDSLEIYIYTNNFLKLVRQTKSGITSLAESLMRHAIENEDEDLKWQSTEELTQTIIDHIKETVDHNKIREYNNIDSGIEPSADRMARQIERTIDYFKNQVEPETIDAVIVNGEISGYAPLTDLISEYTGISVFSSQDILDDDLCLSHGNSICKNNDFITGLGTLYCSNEHTPNILFTHRHEKASKIISFLNKSVLATGVVVLAICSVIYSAQVKNVNKLKNKKEGLTKDINQYSPELNSAILSETASKLLANKELLKKKAKILEPGVLINEFVKAGSDNIKIKDFKLNLDQTNRQITFSGYVTGPEYTLDSRLADYVLNLSSSEMFSNVSVNSQEKISFNNKNIIRFSALIKI
ncbi:MAG: hypothetical protein ACQEQS_07060 [Thermodesulfobacteriota bacterium]